MQKSVHSSYVIVIHRQVNGRQVNVSGCLQEEQCVFRLGSRLDHVQVPIVFISPPKTWPASMLTSVSIFMLFSLEFMCSFNTDYNFFFQKINNEGSIFKGRLRQSPGCIWEALTLGSMKETVQVVLKGTDGCFSAWAPTLPSLQSTTVR